MNTKYNTTIFQVPPVVHGAAYGQGFGGFQPGFPAVNPFGMPQGLPALRLPGIAAPFGIPPLYKAEVSEKEVLEGVNRCVWQLYEEEQRKGGQAQQPFQGSTRKPKSSKAERFFQPGGKMSELEVYLAPRLGFEETLFDPRVMQHVKKTYPEFYVKYPTAKAVSNARDKYRPVWRYS